VITIRKALYSGLALVATGAVLAGCAAAPTPTSEPTEAPTTEPTTEPALDFLPCIVSDAGGWDDASFNYLAKVGIDTASAELGVESIEVESDGEDDYAPNISSLVDEGCDLIITVGFALSAATVEAAIANPDIEFAIVDDAADNDFDGVTDAENIRPLLFDTAQAAFLAGYAAADTSKTGVVGTFGGVNFPTVSIFMDGFAQGVAYYNEENGTAVKVVGWDIAAQDGTFVSTDPAIGFNAGPEALATAQGILNQNADVILPVGGPIYQSAGTAITDSGKDIALIGVDSDTYETDQSGLQPLFLTSVRKLIDAAVYDTVMAAGADEFTNEPFIGTLENGGVGVADFHDWASKVKPELAADLETVSAGIIDGTIPVTSYLAG
jgi:basic membrane protein A